jgi:hypothetical protein
MLKPLRLRAGAPASRRPAGRPAGGPGRPGRRGRGSRCLGCQCAGPAAARPDSESLGHCQAEPGPARRHGHAAGGPPRRRALPECQARSRQPDSECQRSAAGPWPAPGGANTWPHDNLHGTRASGCVRNLLGLGLGLGQRLPVRPSAATAAAPGPEWVRVTMARADS